MPRDRFGPPPPARPDPPINAPAQLAQLSGQIAGSVGNLFGELPGGFRDAYAIGAPAPGQAAANLQDSELAKVNKAIRAAGGTPIPTNPEEQLRALLTTAGVDVNNPQVATLIVTLAPHLGALSPSQVQALVANQVQLHPLPQAPGVADYNTAVSSYGFGAGFADFTGQTLGLGGIPHTAEAVKNLPNAKLDTQEYIINPENGALLYKNGVIFDPGTGNLVFPQGDPSVAGSGSWMHSVTKWSPDKVLEWRKSLGEQGYLVPSEALNGSGEADATFLAAISAYQNARYANYGTPIAKSSVDLSQYGPQGNKIFDLTKVRASIISDVRSQYRTVFGQDPSAGELKSWTDFIINRGMASQRQGLDPAQAESNAVSALGDLAYSSPQGQYLQTQAEENTSLHDALSSAVAATASVTR